MSREIILIAGYHRRISNTFNACPYQRTYDGRYVHRENFRGDIRPDGASHLPYCIGVGEFIQADVFSKKFVEKNFV